MLDEQGICNSEPLIERSYIFTHKARKVVWMRPIHILKQQSWSSAMIVL